MHTLAVFEEPLPDVATSFVAQGNRKDLQRTYAWNMTKESVAGVLHFFHYSQGTICKFSQPPWIF